MWWISIYYNFVPFCLLIHFTLCYFISSFDNQVTVYTCIHSLGLCSIPNFSNTTMSILDTVMNFSILWYCNFMYLIRFMIYLWIFKHYKLKVWYYVDHCHQAMIARWYILWWSGHINTPVCRCVVISIFSKLRYYLTNIPKYFWQYHRPGLQKSTVSTKMFEFSSLHYLCENHP